MKHIFAALICLTLMSGCSMQQKEIAMADEPERNMFEELPIIIAHRGASGERPEHTMAAYELAIEQGADYIEPDLVLTKDGVLVARHENEIGDTTNVADHTEFADRKATKMIDGRETSGWFTEDFTLAELKTLRAKERLPQLRPQNTKYDGKFAIPTFEEILALLKAHEKKTGKRIGVYPETKHPSYFADIGLPHEKPLLKLLAQYGFDTVDDPVFIQSFEVGNLEQLRGKTTARLVQLIADQGGPPDRKDLLFVDMITPEGLADIAKYANGIGITKSLVKGLEPREELQVHRPFILATRKAGLLVHVWTFRRENYFIDQAYRKGSDPRATGNIDDEIESYLGIGINGLFSDNPREAARAAYMYEAE